MKGGSERASRGEEGAAAGVPFLFRNVPRTKRRIYSSALGGKMHYSFSRLWKTKKKKKREVAFHLYLHRDLQTRPSCRNQPLGFSCLLQPGLVPPGTSASCPGRALEADLWQRLCLTPEKIAVWQWAEQSWRDASASPGKAASQLVR